MIKGDKKVSLEQAIERCCQAVNPGLEEEIELEQALGRVAAQSLLSRLDVPGFARSKVDGFTIVRGDLSLLKQQGRLFLENTGQITAGQNCCLTPLPGQTVRVATGAMLPPGTVAVVKEEETTNHAERIEVLSSLRAGENVEPAGSRMAAGQLLARASSLLDAEVIELLSSAAWSRIPVHKKPGVFVINTGSELAVPGQPLKAGQIYASNFTYLGSKVQAAGAELAGGYHNAADCEKELLSCLKQGISQAGLVLIAGGTGSGAHDLTLDVLDKMEADILFNSIASRPGRNVAAALCEKTLIISLPGQPHASGILFDVLVMPIIHKMMGVESCHHNWVALKLAGDVISSQHRSLRRGVLVSTGEGLAACLKEDGHPVIRPLIMDIHPGQGPGEQVKAIIL